MATAKETEAPAAAEPADPIIIDLGKKKKKHVKRLKKGRGRLMSKVGGHLDDLQDMGHIDENHQPVIVVVRQKARRRRRRRRGGFGW